MQGACQSLKRKNPSSDDQLNHKAHELDGMQKKLKRSSKSAEKDTNYQSPMQNGVHNKHKKNGPRDEKEGKDKLSMQGGLQKKLEPNSSKNFKQVEVQNNLKTRHVGTAKGKKCKIPDQDVQKKAKPNNRSTEEDAKIRTREQDEVLKKNKLNSPSSETTLLGRSQELSARRMKVMQSLGLIAPSGSPFHKNGQFCLSLC
ncbi:hypothetical protein SLA2020_434850 [Shorea laevis]